MHTNEIEPPRVALVTGAGTGIGRAVALEFLAQGYRVVLAGRRREPLEATRTAAGEDGGVEFGVGAGLGLAQLHHQVLELLR